jgi:hyperosmotically inducible periplasmic protein
MKFTTKFPVVALAALLALAPLAQASTTSAGRYDSKIQSSVAQKLDDKSDFKNVRYTVEDGIVTLTGSVNSYKLKLDAEKQARKSNNQVKGVRNLIEVAGPSVSDAELQKKLTSRISRDRVGYYDVAFNAVTVTVNDGVVTLGGFTADYPAYNDALAIAQNTAGVRDVVNNMRVLPTSGFDDSLRARLYRAIYFDSVLSKYAMDPVRPIRIVVSGGNVALYGQVDSAADRSIAGIRARQVFGGFSVENNLTLPNQAEAR